MDYSFRKKKSGLCSHSAKQVKKKKKKEVTRQTNKKTTQKKETKQNRKTTTKRPIEEEKKERKKKKVDRHDLIFHTFLVYLNTISVLMASARNLTHT